MKPTQLEKAALCVTALVLTLMLGFFWGTNSVAAPVIITTDLQEPNTASPSQTAQLSRTTPSEPSQTSKASPTLETAQLPQPSQLLETSQAPEPSQAPETSQSPEPSQSPETSQSPEPAQTTPSASAPVASQPASATKTSGKININTATQAQLQTLSGIGEKRAAAIVEYRQAHGSFARTADLCLVQGIGTGILSKIQDYITVGD